MELLEMVNYDGEACVTSGQGDNTCAKVPGRGVIVNPGTTDVKNLDNETVGLHIQPNPAASLVYITVGTSAPGTSLLSIIAADGRLITQRRLTAVQAGESVALDVSTLPAGIYTVRFESSAGVGVEKLVVK